MDFGIERVYYAIEAKDNIYKIRINIEDLKAVYLNLSNLLGDNLDFFLKTIKYAYKVLVSNFLSWMDNWNDNEQLIQIESIFINYTKLQSELHTSGIKNKDLKAFAFYGLHAVEFIKGEYEPCLKNILYTYIINPRMARYNLYYYLYEFSFYPMISNDLKIDLACINKDYRYIDDKNLSVDQMRQLSDLNRYRLEEIEQMIDYQCVCIAEQVLKEMEDRGAKL